MATIRLFKSNRNKIYILRQFSNFTQCFMLSWFFFFVTTTKYKKQTVHPRNYTHVSRVLLFVADGYVSVHRNENVVVLTKFTTLAALEVVILTTSSAANVLNFVKLTPFPRQCLRHIFFVSIYLSYHAIKVTSIQSQFPFAPGSFNLLCHTCIYTGWWMINFVSIN